MKWLGAHLREPIQFRERHCVNDKERKIIVESIRYVDLVIPEKNWGQKINDVKKHSIDIFVMGSDWTGEFDFLKEYCEVIYLPRTPEISTSGTIKRLRK